MLALYWHRTGQLLCCEAVFLGKGEFLKWQWMLVIYKTLQNVSESECDRLTCKQYFLKLLHFLVCPWYICCWMSSVMPSPEESKHVNIMSSCGVLFAFSSLILLLRIRSCTSFLFICCTISIFSTKFLLSWVGQRKMLARCADGWQAATQPGAWSPHLPRPRGLIMAWFGA